METKLLQIANTILLNCQYLNKNGLLDGKMGVVIFLYHYARLTNNTIYNTYADELLDEIIASIRQDLSFDFKTGLLGIVWGINYLIKNKFIEGDSDQLLKSIDQFLMKNVEEQIMHCSQSGNSLFGLGIYLLSKTNFNNEIQSAVNKSVIILSEIWKKETKKHRLFWESVLICLVQLKKRKEENKYEKELKENIESYLNIFPVDFNQGNLEFFLEKNWQNFIFYNQYSDYNREIFDLIKNENLSLEKRLTIDNGLAGIGIGLLKTTQ